MIKQDNQDKSKETVTQPDSVAGDYRCIHAHSHAVNHGPYAGERCPKCGNVSWSLK